MSDNLDSDLTGFQLELPYELGRYRLEAEIGRGGMGIVYHAEDTMLDRPVAVKVLLPQLAADSQFVQRFKREAQMAARLEHPNIVTVHDVGQVEGLVYFVMRLVTGKPLDRLMEEGLPWSRAETIAVQVAEAMAYAHEHHVIHRDIKPENVIVSREGIVTITDFGLARPEQQAGGPTQAGVILGTPGYMAPEQALGKDVDHRADIYAFGVMLFELISGDLPYDGETAFSIINQHISAPIPDVRQLKPNTPPWLAELVERALAKNPEDRPRSMSEVSETLRSQQGSEIEKAAAAKTGEEDVSAQGLVRRIRAGEMSLAAALHKHPDVSQTLQEVFRREMTVISFDLAGSTQLKQTSGGTIAIGPVFNAYREMVDQALAAHNCEDAVWAGDGTVALFNLPSDAVLAAQDILRNLRDINARFPDTPDLGVRIGIHTGSILRDPNQALGQVTSTVLDQTGHLQKDARPGLVEISQATLDKLPSQEGWIRIRAARDSNMAVFAWHPDGPDQVPQSWIQRIRYGRGEEEAEAKGEAKAKRPVTATKDKPAKPEEEALHCPYCEGEVTVRDQKCPHCDRLNRHYDPAIAEKGKRKRAATTTTTTTRRPRTSTVATRSTLVERAGDPRRTTAVGSRATQQRSGSGSRQSQQQAAGPDVLSEMIIGIIVGAVLVCFGAWVFKDNFATFWWVDRGARVQTSMVALLVLAAIDIGVGYSMRLTQPAMAFGVFVGLPVAMAILRYLKWWT